MENHLSDQKESVKHSPFSFHIMNKPIGPICNLDCSYCFYLEKEDLYPEQHNFRMSDQALEAYTKQYIESQPLGTAEVNFAWQGGEPTLMGIDFFKKALELQKKYQRPGMEISNALQTNGTLLNDKWGKFLHEHRFLVGLSVDGPKEIHDHYRYYKGGKGSFDKVMDGLKILQDFKVEYNTLTVVQEHNSKYPSEIYDFLKSIGSTFFQFIPIVEHRLDSTKGRHFGENTKINLKLQENIVLSDRCVPPTQWGHFLNGIFDAWLDQKDIGQIYVQFFDMMLGIVVQGRSSLCVHAKTCGKATAMEHNGDLYSCDHYVTPKYHLGNVLKDDLADLLQSEQQKKFGNDKFDTLPQYCKDCDYLKYCYGACPKDRILKTPSGEPGLHYLCEGYKLFYEHTEPVFKKMAECLALQVAPARYKEIDAIKLKTKNQLPTQEVGRNDLCPCGSGKKYKKCCGKR